MKPCQETATETLGSKIQSVGQFNNISTILEPRKRIFTELVQRFDGGNAYLICIRFIVMFRMLFLKKGKSFLLILNMTITGQNPTVRCA